MHVCVCICTFRRPRLLRKLLVALAEQRTEGQFTYSIVVADNDAARTAEFVVIELARALPLSIDYVVEPDQNIAKARNTAVSHARGEFIAWIDDDEVPPNHWLLTAIGACEAFGADGVLGPVRPYFEHEPPAWVKNGHFFDRPEHKTGHLLAWRETRTGNVVLRKRILEKVTGPFDVAYGAGGEDQELFRRLMAMGFTFAWCGEAAVQELVPPERCRRRYLLKRAMQRGLSERGLVTPASICKSLVAVPLYTLALPVLALAGHDWFMRYCIRLCDHLGKLMGIVGYRPWGRRYQAD